MRSGSSSPRRALRKRHAGAPVRMRSSIRPIRSAGGRERPHSSAADVQPRWRIMGVVPSSGVPAAAMMTSMRERDLAPTPVPTSAVSASILVCT